MQPRATRVRMLLVVLVSALALVLAQGLVTGAGPSAQSTDPQGQTIPVNCDQGQSINQALRAAREGATIRVSGTCQETVRVTTDGLTIDGGGTAVLDGARAGVALTIAAARGVAVRGLTVRDGTRGIDVLELATVTLDDVTVEQSRSHGVEVTNASVTARNLVSERNGRAGLIVNRNSLLTLTAGTFRGNLTGLVVYSNASARLIGTNVMSDNATQGLTVGLGAVLFAIGATVRANDNGEEGVLLLQEAGLELIGGRLEAIGNALDGVKVQQASSMTVGIAEFGTLGTAVVEGNAGHGIAVGLGSNLTVSQVMPLESTGNDGSGLWVDDGSAVRVEASTFGANGEADVALSFGARATLDGNAIGTIDCDASALSRGSTTCP